jgi:GT2 family glycosyltransferase
VCASSCDADWTVVVFEPPWYNFPLMQESAPRVLVAVLHYNGGREAIETVTSLKQQVCPDLVLQVFDNASKPGALDEMRRVHPGVIIRESPTNLGYTGGNNAILDQAAREGFDCAVLCNQDIELDREAIAAVVETACQHPDAGIVGGVEVCHFTDVVRARGAKGFSFWTSRAAWRAQQQRHVSDATDAHAEAVDYVQGALVLFTRRAIDAGIRFDDDLFLYYDEIDLGFQVKHAGLRAYLDHRVIVRHKNRDNFLNVRAGYYHQRNRAYIIHKHGAWWQRAAYHAYAFGLELPLKCIVRGLQGHGRFARACVLGHLDGLRGRMGAGRAASL